MKVCACLQKLKCLCVRLHGVVCRHCYRVGKAKRQSIKISQPFDFKHVSSNPMGLDEDEINVLREKAAASRMVAIEDQPRSNPSSAPCSPPASLFHQPAYSSYSSNTTALFPHHSYHQHQQRPRKTRAGYRSLASSTNHHNHHHRGGGGGLSYSTLTTASRPSITRSFAAAKEEEEEVETEETQTQASLSPASSFTTASTRGSLKYHKKRGFEFSGRPL